MQAEGDEVSGGCADFSGQGYLAAPGTGGGIASKGHVGGGMTGKKGSPGLVGAVFVLVQRLITPRYLPPQRRVAQQQLGL